MRKLLWLALLLPTLAYGQGANRTVNELNNYYRFNNGTTSQDSAMVFRNLGALPNGYTVVWNSTTKRFTSGGAPFSGFTIGTISNGGNANGLSLVGSSLRLFKVNATNGGVLTTGTDTIAGAKLFNGRITSAAGITISGGTASSLGTDVNFTGSRVTFTNGSSTTFNSAINSFTSSVRITGVGPGTAGTDSLLVKDATTNVIRKIAANYYATTGSAGTVTSASVVSANGFAGTVATATTTPAITLTTTVTGLLKGNGTAISAATSNTDYLPVNNPVATGTVTAPSLSLTNGGGTTTLSGASTTQTITLPALSGTVPIFASTPTASALAKWSGTGGALISATSGTDYVIPSGSVATVTGSSQAAITSVGQLVNLQNTGAQTMSNASSLVYSATNSATFNRDHFNINTNGSTGTNSLTKYDLGTNALGDFGFVKEASGFGKFVWNQNTGSPAETMSLGSTGNWAISGTATVPLKANLASGTNLGDYVAIGTNTQSSFCKLCVIGSGATYNLAIIQDNVDQTGANFISFLNSSGASIGGVARVTTTNAVVFNTTSDRRLKMNIIPSKINATSVLNKIGINQYDWRTGGRHEDFGVIAQDLYKIVPNSVTLPKDLNDPKQSWMVDKSSLVPLLIKALQEANDRISVLEAKIK